jgi:hypothetical protein
MTQQGFELEEHEISLITKVGHDDLVTVGEREKIVVDALGDDEGSTSFCWHIDDERKKTYLQAMHQRGRDKSR